MRPADRELLQTMPLYQTLGARAMHRLVRGASIESCPKGTTLFREGDEASFVRMILSGRVGLVAQRSDGHDTVIDTFGPGDCIGIPMAVLRRPHIASSRVTADTRLLLIPAQNFRDAVARDRRLALALVDMLARYWCDLVTQDKELKLKTTGQRLASYLVGSAGASSGAATVKLADERKVLAKKLGMSPESLSRAFGYLADFGVASRGSVIHVADLGRLHAYCR